MRKQGSPACHPGTGSVTKYSCSTGTMGSSSPISRASAPDHGPAAMITCSVANRPAAVDTEATAPPRTSIPVTAACAATVTPRSRAADTYAFTRLFGCR